MKASITLCTLSSVFAFAAVLSAQVPASILSNASDLGVIGPGGSLISGFVVTGATPKTLLIRAVGPDLAAFGVAGAASSVALTVSDGAGRVILAATPTTPASLAAVQVGTALGAFPLASAGSIASLVVLLPGAYTLLVAPGAPDAAGLALLETYDADVLGGGGNVHLGVNDSGGTATMVRGGLITVSLQTNPSTGFQWSVTTPPNPQILELIAHTVQAPLVHGLGASSTETWSYWAVGSGPTTVSMSYSRTGSSQDATTYSFAATVP